MVVLAFLLFAAGLVSLVLLSRGIGATLIAAAAVFWLLPELGDGGQAGALPPGFTAAAEPAAAPAIAFKSASGRRLSLSDFRGRVVLLNIWATWCGPCREEMPSLDRLQSLHGGDGLAVLAVSVDEGGTTTVRRFYEQAGIRNLTPYIDSGRATQSALHARAIPMTLLIDRDGRVAGSMVGAAEWDSPAALALVRRYLDAPSG